MIFEFQVIRKYSNNMIVKVVMLKMSVWVDFVTPAVNSNSKCGLIRQVCHYRNPGESKLSLSSYFFRNTTEESICSLSAVQQTDNSRAQ